MTPEHARAVLTYASEIEPIERRVRRRERIWIPVSVASAIGFAIACAVTSGGYSIVALVCAIGYALIARAWVLGAVARRRDWRVISEAVAEARRTLDA